MVIMGSFTGLLIPLLVMMVKLTIKWTRVEDRLARVADDLARMVRAKDQTHEEIVEKLDDVSRGLDTRLRWLEENAWIRNPPVQRRAR